MGGEGGNQGDEIKREEKGEKNTGQDYSTGADAVFQEGLKYHSSRGTGSKGKQ